MLRLRAAACSAIVLVGTLLSAQARREVPPLPRQEQWRPNPSLVAAVRISSPQLRTGEAAALTLEVRNTGRNTVLIPPATGINTTVRVYGESGAEIKPRGVVAMYHRVVLLASVRTLLTLRPGEAKAFPLALPVDFGPGRYRIEASYYNFADSPQRYDVYEKDAAMAWEGEALSSTQVEVLPLDRETERELIDAFREGRAVSGASPLYRLAFGGTAAINELIALFERDDNSRRAVVLALANSRNPEAAARLAAALERLDRPKPPLGSQLFLIRFDRDLLELVRHAPGCDGLPLLPYSVQVIEQEIAKPLERQCANLRAIMQQYIELAAVTPADAPDGAAHTLRAEGATRVLNALNRPPPATQTTTVDVEPVLQKTLLPSYLAKVLAGRDGSEAYHDALRGIARFGTVAMFRELHERLHTADEDSWPSIAEALHALSFFDDDPPLYTASDARRVWNAWWRTHEWRTRTQWAEETLSRPAPPSNYRTRASDAAAYLLGLEDGKKHLRRLLTHRSWHVRLAAAETVAQSNPGEGADLIRRELLNRYVAACRTAAGRLRVLARDNYEVDCYSERGRQAAFEHWSALGAVARR